MNRLVICGSFRPEGKSAHLCDALARRMHDLWPEDEINLFSLADDIDVDPCIACDYCELGEGCIIEDAMQDLYALLDEADSLVVVSPIYFAGPPAQFKAVLDRFQRYFWTDVRTKPKRPAELFAIGDGGDPHGFDPLTGIVRSALAVAGYRLGAVHDCVGKTHDELYAIAAAWEPAQGGISEVFGGGLPCSEDERAAGGAR
ncbi:flavodoxin family protein [Raoultibacter phocaeensis]|uniref:flavodoxin family protein n=1 Tax=Raoultibacter phocaeensis TaxID=2479841 RepID=UPI0015D5AD8D|nr:flavodoxin family protein [Raoultibacter phocaeensis]